MDVEFSRVIERDVDLLLAEELASSRQFLSWFLGSLGIQGTITVRSVEHSVSGPSGESDLEVFFECDGRSLAVLIEDKIDAAFQPRQEQRYRQRGRAYVRKKKCEEFRTVLVAPSKYLGDEPEKHGFDAALSYEDIRGWFDGSAELGPRKIYKLSLLDTAIERGEGGWTLVPDANATKFWNRYWELTRILAPELNMKKPGVKPATSAFIHFYPSGLPRGATVIHKVPYGNVDIQFAGKAKQVGTLADRYGKNLQAGMKICAAGKSAVIRLEVPEVDIAAPFDEIEGALREGIWAARHLLLWFKTAAGSA